MGFPCRLPISLSRRFILSAPPTPQRRIGPAGTSMRSSASGYSVATEEAARDFGLQTSGTNKQMSDPIGSVFRQRCRSEGRKSPEIFVVAVLRSPFGLSFSFVPLLLPISDGSFRS